MGADKEEMEHLFINTQKGWEACMYIFCDYFYYKHPQLKENAKTWFIARCLTLRVMQEWWIKLGTCQISIYRHLVIDYSCVKFHHLGYPCHFFISPLLGLP